MYQHTLKPAYGSTKKAKRVGRGNASGHGTYATRGQKGQGQRSGGKKKAGFEGGQTPLHRRMPKLKGFKSLALKNTQVLNLRKLNQFSDGTEITPVMLKAKGLIKNEQTAIKILGTGDLQKKLTFKGITLFSKSAQEKIKKAGGEV